MLRCGVLMALLLTCSAVQAARDNFSSVNKRAAREYLTPVRPGYAGRNPFWNEYAVKFIYAPAFDFKTLDGAVRYRFTITTEKPSPTLPKGQDAKKSWTFLAATPTAPLSPVWNDIPGGTEVKLRVTGVDKAGKELGVAGERKFLRDFPFCGPYPQKLYSYRECIRRALRFLHNVNFTAHWDNSLEPDSTYPLYGYIAKCVGATLRHEVLYARWFPKDREVALKRCKHVLQYLKSVSQPEGSPCAWFPPTYGKGGRKNITQNPRNIGTTMMMEPCKVANSCLDVYEYCGDKEYLDYAVNIIRTYRKLMRPDGSFPIKIRLADASEVTHANATPFELMNALKRLKEKDGITEFEPMREKIVNWVETTLLETFDFEGMFEDGGVEGLRPYRNLTNCSAIPVAFHLLDKPNRTKKDISDAEEIVRFCEDQFVYWRALPDKDGIPWTQTPCCVEQYYWRESTDNSTAYMYLAFARMWEATGNDVYRAKAEALAASIFALQDKFSGLIPTAPWRTNRYNRGDEVQYFWNNCCAYTVEAMGKLREILGED